MRFGAVVKTSARIPHFALHRRNCVCELRNENEYQQRVDSCAGFEPEVPKSLYRDPTTSDSPHAGAFSTIIVKNLRRTYPRIYRATIASRPACATAPPHRLRVQPSAQPHWRRGRQFGKG